MIKKVHLRQNEHYARCGIMSRRGRGSVVLSSNPNEITCSRCRQLGDLTEPGPYQRY